MPQARAISGLADVTRHSGSLADILPSSASCSPSL
jgi:hypothetical protein